MVIVNKWDAVPNKETNTLRDFEADLKAQLRPIDWALVVFTSATTGQRVARVLDAVAAAAEQHRSYFHVSDVDRGFHPLATLSGVSGVRCSLR